MESFGRISLSQNNDFLPVWLRDDSVIQFTILKYLSNSWMDGMQFCTDIQVPQKIKNKSWCDFMSFLLINYN